MARAGEQVAGLGAHRRAGFTLLEMLVALAVISVATGVIIRLFNASLDASSASRHQRVAAGIAEEMLQTLTAHPERFVWDKARGPELGGITMKGASDARLPVATPSVLPVAPAAAARSESLYRQLSCEAYGRVPGEHAPYYEVTVVVRWNEGGRPRLVALTGAAPRACVEKAP